MYSTESICTNSIRTLLGGGDPRNPSPRTEPRTSCWSVTWDSSDACDSDWYEQYVHLKVITSSTLLTGTKEVLWTWSVSIWANFLFTMSFLFLINAISDGFFHEAKWTIVLLNTLLYLISCILLCPRTFKMFIISTLYAHSHCRLVIWVYTIILTPFWYT